MIDPYDSKVRISYQYPDPREVRADAVYVTHPHYDHDVVDRGRGADDRPLG